MFAIAVELLTGRYVATAYNDRDRAEWPPHPARLFSALVATWAESATPDDPATGERLLLEWLEQQPAPDVLSDPGKTAGLRRVVPVFVPVNDISQVSAIDRTKLETAEDALRDAADDKTRAKLHKEVEKLRAKFTADTLKAIAAPAKFGKDQDAGLRLLPEHRPKQPRTFPCATPQTPRFAFVWPNSDVPEVHSDDLRNILRRVVRIGHSSSLVRVHSSTAESLAEWSKEVAHFRPNEQDAELVLRWVEPGQVTRLCRAYDRHRETEPRVLPAVQVTYASQDSYTRIARPQSVFSDEWIVFARRAGPRLPSTSAVGLARQFRRALMSGADEPIAEIISGHVTNGAPSERPHLAVIPLPVVAGPHADGAILGIALALPRDCSPEDRQVLMRALGRLEQRNRGMSTADPPSLSLHLSRDLSLELQRLAWRDGAWTLNRTSWCRPSRRWATATPIALDRNPGDLHHPNPAKRNDAFEAAQATVAEALARIGLPPASQIDVVRSCVLPGTAKPGSFPRYPIDQTRPQRVLVHARLEFDSPVRGPILLGAGRYHGLGLCLPVDRQGER